MVRHRLPWLPAWLAAILLLFSLAARARAQADTPTPTATPLTILSPLPNAAVQGIVPVRIRVDFKDVQSAELTFGYAGDRTGTWFFINQTEGPALEEKLADWDTTTLTDGNYTLRLSVTRQDGSQFAVLAANLRVRNYSPIETDTPTPSPTPAPGETPEPTITPTLTPSAVPPTPTPLPPNPLEMSSRTVAAGFVRGVGTVFVLFALLGLYGSARRFLRK